jgi:phospholipid/cholesterol/gamma-HCH transport system permease protein
MTARTGTPAQTAAQELARPDAGTLAVRFRGAFALGSPLPGLEDVRTALEAEPRPAHLVFDATDLTRWDSRFLVHCRKIMDLARAAGVEVETAGLPAGALRLLDLAAKVPERKGAARTATREAWLARLGGRSQAAWQAFTEVLDFLGEVTLAVYNLARGRAVMRRSDFLALLHSSGAQALPIVSLISALVGLILAFVGAVQLVAFGAQIYVSSLVGIAMIRVMGAIMTGIIMAGRTGAAFAAELGTMQVNEEIDALRTLGVSPMEFLVLPRLLALVVMMPLLCIYADLMGVLGGFVVGVFMLDLNPAQYLAATWDSVALANFWIGLVHSAVFGVLVALAGCYRGMHCGRSASAVGQATTSAVVTSIISIIVATAIITVICNILGI